MRRESRLAIVLIGQKQTNLAGKLEEKCNHENSLIVYMDNAGLNKPKPLTQIIIS
jgi:hypothetical protein